MVVIDRDKNDECKQISVLESINAVLVAVFMCPLKYSFNFEERMFGGNQSRIIRDLSLRSL